MKVANRLNAKSVCLYMATLWTLLACADGAIVTARQAEPIAAMRLQPAELAALSHPQTDAGTRLSPANNNPAFELVEVLITPLFHSASITLQNIATGYQARVTFQQDGALQWQQALDLQHEPVHQNLSGSLVGLAEDSQYHLRIRLYQDEQLKHEFVRSFHTRSNQPPIDPNKIYRLQDIYQGGVLDLEALKIEGKPDGWAKIVGNGQLTIQAGEQDDVALNIGDNSYIYFENIRLRGGRRHAISSLNAHHLWFNRCDVAGWGRYATDIRDGLAYENDQASQPINYDAGFNLQQSGVIVIEHCHVHSPVPAANHWGYGHPHGATAFLAAANHPNPDFAGQIVLRYNHFVGTDKHRFNDVIESRSNGQSWGGFVRDSAIHDNVIAFANDDLIELDGGQSNVLVYNNDLQQGYSAISATPIRQGPSYIFHNHIYNLGDQRQRAWAAIKLGGMLSAPIGKSLIFENLVISRSNGIAAANFKGDNSFWTDARNNVFIHDRYWQVMGYGIYDELPLDASNFVNNYLFNLATGQPEYRARLDLPFSNPDMLQRQVAEQLSQQGSPIALSIPPALRIANFSRLTSQDQVLIGALPINTLREAK
ncbi:hypothetical protein KJY73_18450 [Bowmanella sp. Y26]|uniref:hypothetical protein n=1 Tax=Bowmanella yangjiangensis TaxID=2811230 RepID=UPI001BDD99B4|nr:hypothetical protein [Bowmanella yangjiangensis]MBT1065567.1 hypothetical protein [Bowmanella yangjiangensis]